MNRFWQTTFGLGHGVAVCPVSSLTGLAFICDGNPGLTPGAILCRRCATGVQECSMPTAEILTRPVNCVRLCLTSHRPAILML